MIFENITMTPSNPSTKLAMPSSKILSQTFEKDRVSFRKNKSFSEKNSVSPVRKSTSMNPSLINHDSAAKSARAAKSFSSLLPGFQPKEPSDDEKQFQDVTGNDQFPSIKEQIARNISKTAITYDYSDKLNGEEHEYTPSLYQRHNQYVPYKHQLDENDDYPTPEPSSTLGRNLSSEDESQSPFEEDEGSREYRDTRHPQLPSSPIYSPMLSDEADDIDEISHDADMTMMPHDTLSKQQENVFSYNYSVEQPTYAPASMSNVPFTVRSPLRDVAVIHVPRDGREISIGRSSKCCDFALSRYNRLVSRVHVKVQFVPDINRIRFRCVGWNGCTVIVPEYTLSEKPTVLYSNNINEEDQNQSIEDEETPQSVQQLPMSSGVTDYMIPRDLGIEVDYVAGITVDVRGERGLIQVVDTEQENRPKVPESRSLNVTENIESKNTEKVNNAASSLKQKQSIEYKTKKMIDSSAIKTKTVSAKQQETREKKHTNKSEQIQQRSSLSHTSSKRKSTILSSDSGNDEASSESGTKLLKKRKSEIVSSNITKPKSISPASPRPLSSSSRPSSSSSSAIKKNPNSTLKKATTPKPELKSTQENVSQDKKKIAKPEHVEKKSRKSISPVPQSKTKTSLTSSQEKSEVSQSGNSENSTPSNAVKTLKIDEAQARHVISTYLAFSRLHSTPISAIINSIPSLREHMSESEEENEEVVNFVRSVLTNTEWIGVINRVGKDAAGKPLEEEYFYIQENDQDMDRKELVDQIKGRGTSGLRSCRQKHIQYYWKKPAKK